VALHIEDTGNGISEKDLPRVFDPFFTTKPNGTGLGLCVAQGIITDHGGRIDIVSDPKRGTQVTIELPMVLG
jgi:signal transduction histidine kinase